MVCITVFLQIRLVITAPSSMPVVILSWVNTSTCQRTRYKTFKSFVIAKHILVKKIESSTNVNYFFIWLFSFKNDFYSQFSFYYVSFNFSFYTLRLMWKLWSRMLSFHLFYLKQYWISKHKLNADYMNPLWHNIHFSLFRLNKYGHLSTLFWDTIRLCTLCWN